jgi:hypothetical protein
VMKVTRGMGYRAYPQTPGAASGADPAATLIRGA